VWGPRSLGMVRGGSGGPPWRDLPTRSGDVGGFVT
jgi:hypothetical protein